MREFVLLPAWIIAVVYSSIPLFWFVIHPMAGKWRRMRRSPYRVLLPLWMLMIAALAVLTSPWRHVALYQPIDTWPKIILGVCGGIFFWNLATQTYRRIPEFGIANFIGQSELRPEESEQKLITTGLHAEMRHPIYFAHLCMLAGWTLLSGLVIDFVLLGISAFITFPLMVRLEEQELVQRFGEVYRQYQKNVPLVPLFSRRAGETA